MMAPTPPMKLMMPLACERYLRGGDIRHQRHHRRAPQRHAEQQGAGAGHKQRQHSSQGDQAKGHRADRRADQDEGHAPPDGRAQAVRPGAHRRLDEQRGDVIQGHEEADQRRRQPELVRQEERHEGVVHPPDDADAEKTEAEQEDLAVVEFHDHLLCSPVTRAIAALACTNGARPAALQSLPAPSGIAGRRRSNRLFQQVRAALAGAQQRLLRAASGRCGHGRRRRSTSGTLQPRNSGGRV